MPREVLWVTDLVESFDHSATGKEIEDNREATATAQKVKQNTKSKSIIDRKNNNLSVYDN